MPDWLLVLLIVGATARLARVVTADYITRPMRGYVNRRFGDNRFSYFVTCDACVSFWAGLAVAAVGIYLGDHQIVQVILAGLSASAATILIAQIESD